MVKSSLVIVNAKLPKIRRKQLERESARLITEANIYKVFLTDNRWGSLSAICHYEMISPRDLK